MSEPLQYLVEQMDKLEELLKPDAIIKAIGEGAAPLFADHFMAVDAARSQYGSEYYKKAGETTTFRADPEEAVITTEQIGINLHYYGGTVVPINAEWLTIPAIAEAHGKRAREFSNLRFVYFGFRPNGKELAALFDRESDEPFYWLVKETHHTADPTIIPDEDAIENNVRDSVAAHLMQ